MRKLNPVTRDTWVLFGLPMPAVEVRVCSDRKWRIDFVFFAADGRTLAVEINGGTWARKDSHASPLNLVRDMSKGHRVMLAGMLRAEFTPAQVHSGYAAAIVHAFLDGRRNPDLPPDPEHRQRKSPRAARHRGIPLLCSGRTAR